MQREIVVMQMAKKQLCQTFEYKILIKWVLFTELICLLILLAFMVADELVGNGFFKYAGMRQEGIHTIQVWDYHIDTEDIIRYEYKGHAYKDDVEITTYRLECSVVLDGKEYFFTADAVDVIGENSMEAALECINYTKEVTGYLYSAHNRERFCFSHSIDEASSLLYEKAKFRYLLNCYRTYDLKIIVYIIVGVYVLHSFKIRDNKSIIDIVIDKLAKNWVETKFGIKERKSRTVMAKDNHSDKAIKRNPEYIWFEKQEFEQKYSPEIIAVVETLKAGEYRISAKQTEVTKESLKKGTSRQKLTGPILEKCVLGHDAVLLMVGLKNPFTRKRWVKLIERTMEGNYAERKFKVDCACVRNISGNYVFVVNGKDDIGIYENVSKNEDNPILLNYACYMKENTFSKIGCYIQQGLLAVVSFVVLMAVWLITKDWLIFPKTAFCLVAARLYKHLIDLLRRKYIVKCGTIACESMFQEFWKGPYIVLNMIALVIVWFK